MLKSWTFLPLFPPLANLVSGVGGCSGSSVSRERGNDWSLILWITCLVLMSRPHCHDNPSRPQACMWFSPGVIKVCLVKAMVFPVVMYGCKSWTIKKAESKELMLLNCDVREDSWGSLRSKEIQPVHPKADPSWVFIGRTDVGAETPTLWPPDAKSWLIWKDPDAGKDWGQEEKGTTEDEMVGWHHRLNGHEFGWDLGVCDGQGGLVCYSHGVAKSRTRLSDWTELNWANLLLGWQWVQD